MVLLYVVEVLALVFSVMHAFAHFVRKNAYDKKNAGHYNSYVNTLLG